jgi:hypothetical protein
LILDISSIVRLEVALLATFSLIIFGILNSLRDTAELDNKREYVSNVLLQRIGPVVREVNESYREFLTFNEEQAPPGGPQGGFLEDPLASFETKSLTLVDRFDEWTYWKEMLSKSEQHLMWALYISVGGIFLTLLAIPLEAISYIAPFSIGLLIHSGSFLVISFYFILSRASTIRDMNQMWREIKDSVRRPFN